MARGQVRLFALSRPVQVAMALASLLLAGWIVYMSNAHFAQESMLAAREAEIERLRAAYTRMVKGKDAELHESDVANRALRVHVAEQSGELLSRASRIKDYEQRIRDILAQKAALEGSLKEREMELARKRRAYEHSVTVREALAQDLSRVENELEETARRNASLFEEVTLIRGNLDAVQVRKAKAMAEREALQRQLDRANGEVNQLREASASLSEKQKALKKALSGAAAERDQMLAKKSLLEREVQDLTRRNADLKQAQYRLVESFTEKATARSDQIEKALALTGLDVNAILSELYDSSDEDGQPFGKGGPFVAYVPGLGEDPSDRPQSRELYSMLAVLEEHVERWEGLHQLLRKLPLSAPADEFRITSEFGKRRDPINGKNGMHYGVDLACYPKAPALATAPGTVTFVGRMGTLGKVVEIDHGMGIRTRYGHLGKILVEDGEKVEFRQKIGVVGSTGRSTGPHIHYEVLVDGENHDPVKFMEAGKSVFKG